MKGTTTSPPRDKHTKKTLVPWLYTHKFQEYLAKNSGPTCDRHRRATNYNASLDLARFRRGAAPPQQSRTPRRVAFAGSLFLVTCLGVWAAMAAGA